ncbi:TadE family type IV pilus minor pilin, partial [Streptomyces sp. NPDC127112]|uniref:TadE family type IV pilus minor pilin n=1 Tax=Streptomyces sp. NPDC127112 TaxID=3345364 RepID=UPI003644F9D7
LGAAGQFRCVDAARAGARAAARSEPVGAVLAAARQAAPPGAEVELEWSGDLWRVRVAAPAPGPAGLPVRIGARAVALAEDSVGPPP